MKPILFLLLLVCQLSAQSIAYLNGTSPFTTLQVFSDGLNSIGSIYAGTTSNSDMLSYLQGNSGYNRFIEFLSAGSGQTCVRWDMGVNNVAETGSNVGSNFVLYGCSDSGVGLPDACIEVFRDTGHVQLSGVDSDSGSIFQVGEEGGADTTTAADFYGDVHISGPAGEGSLTVNNGISALAGISSKGTNPQYSLWADVNNRSFIAFDDYSGHQTWNIGTDTAQSGSNSGADVRFYAYSDSYSFLGEWLDIIRSNGHVLVNKGGSDDGVNQLQVGGTVSIQSAAPSSSTASGVQGTVTWDSNYIYICVATNTWKRVSISTF